jgi:hypothetical protein
MATMKPVTDIPRFTSIIASAFHATPLTNAFISELDNAPPPFSYERRHKHFASGIEKGANEGAILVESNWSAIAMWEPPDFKGSPFPLTGATGPMRREWRERIAEIKPKTPHWHLQFLARNPELRVEGSIQAVMKPLLERAREAGVPVWLEAVDEKSAALYARFGFRLVEKITVGLGRVDAMGYPNGTEGVSGWCMILEHDSATK